MPCLNVLYMRNQSCPTAAERVLLASYRRTIILSGITRLFPTMANKRKDSKVKGLLIIRVDAG